LQVRNLGGDEVAYLDCTLKVLYLDRMP